MFEIIHFNDGTKYRIHYTNNGTVIKIFDDSRGTIRTIWIPARDYRINENH